MKDLVSTERIEQVILLVRGKKVLLDADLALIYGVPTKVLNQAVKRNLRRFPDDFTFQLTAAEFANLRSQTVISSLQPIDSHADNLNRSQIVTGSQKHRDPRFLPYAFTEHGAIMAANVLNSRRAVQMSVFVVGRLDVHEAATVTVLQRVMDILDPPPPPPPPPPRRIGFRARDEKPP